MDYQECSKCILNNIQDPFIVFNEKGVCNHCSAYENQEQLFPQTETERKTATSNFINELKLHKGKSNYDCIMGLSGGVDSTYLCLKLKELGINPLLVHFDNGWNSELAVMNIQNIVEKLDFDLFTYVVDWEEFKDLQLSFIKAGVLDWEIPSDHGFYATLYQQAIKHKIKSVVSGHNQVTEAILPKCMRWDKLDVINIKDIHKQFGNLPLKTFPFFGIKEQIFVKKIKKIKRYTPLDFMNYNKDEAKAEIQKKLDWKDYGGKHYESIFTRFYQGYVLIEKFGFDKRYAHLSTLINSGQITKEEALNEINKPAYNPSQLEEDKEYVLKKLKLSNSKFEEIMKKPPIPHSAYKTTQKNFWEPYFKMVGKLKPIKQIFG